MFRGSLGAGAVIIGALLGWQYGHITKGKLGSAILIGAAGYVVLFLAYSIWAALFQSSRIDHEQENDIATLKQEVETKTQGWIAAKEETLAEMRKHCDTEKELVAALGELGRVRTEVENNSKAFHEKYAENSHLRAEMDRFKSNRLKEEWQKLENIFHDVSGPSNIDIEAMWSKKDGTGELLWWDLGGGWDENSRTRFKFVMTDAGSMLHESSYVQENLAECLSEPDISMRWILVVYKIVNDPMSPTGGSFIPGEGSSITGAIKDFPNKCILTCAFPASQEKWPMPKTEEA